MSEIGIQNTNEIKFQMAPKTGLAILVAVALIGLMEWLFPSRLALILNIVLPIPAGAALLYIHVRFRSWDFEFLKPFLILLCCGSSIIVLVKSFFYHFPGGPFFVFMAVDLIIGLIVAGFAAIKFGLMEDKKKETVIVIFFVALLFASLLTDAYAKHFNYLFDSNESVEYTTDIIKKKKEESYRRGKKRMIYHLDFRVKGQNYSVQVNESEYEKYEVGDSYTIELHEGAFKKPFILLK